MCIVGNVCILMFINIIIIINIIIAVYNVSMISICVYSFICQMFKF